MTIGARLRLIRQESGLNQTEFGSRIGLSQTTIGLYESDRRTITDRAISQICDTFNINEKWLKDGIGEMHRPTQDFFINDNSLDLVDREILQSYIRMTPAQRQFIKNWILSIAATVSKSTQNPSDGFPENQNEIDPEEEAEVEALRQEFLAQKKAASASASTAAKKA